MNVLYMYLNAYIVDGIFVMNILLCAPVGASCSVFYSKHCMRVASLYDVIP